MMLFSIIIPAYDAESTINRCLDSVYALPISEDRFEVIVIDDCSSDHTIEVVRAYGQVHPNLTLLVQSQNHRQGAARNRGLDVAQGDFIVYLDSDDELLSGVISAVSQSQEYNLDMVVMRYERVSSVGYLERDSILPYESDTIFTGITLQTDHPYLCSAPWAYIYRRSFLKSVNYPFAEDVFFEDSDFVNIHLYNSARMAYCNECGYRVWSNPLSTTHTTSFKHICDYAILGTRMLSFYQQIEDKCSPYAYSILEGGSYNIMCSCKNLFKLKSFSDVCSFFHRFDLFANRSALLSYTEPAYCWNRWTRLCIKHKYCAFLFVGIVLSLNLVPLIKLIKR